MKARADLIVTGASELVTCEPNAGEGPLGIIPKGALAASNGRIVWAGPESELRRNVQPSDGLVEVDAAGGAVLPGLIDCHTHLVFAGDRSAEFAARLRGERYDGGGIASTVDATSTATDAELRMLARARLDRFLSFGVTTVESKSGYGLTPASEERLLNIAASLDHPVDVVRTFLAHVVPPEYKQQRDDYVKMIAEEIIPSLGNLAEFCDVWCDDVAFSPVESRTILRAARAAGLGRKVHAEQTSRSGGAAVAAEFAAVSADHLEHANEDDADALARSKTIGVLLPGASLTTNAPPAPARMLAERGVRLAVSTDFNPGTSYSENLPLALTLACTMLKLTPEEAILGVTRHAAAALSRTSEIGSIAAGKRADCVVLEAAGHLEILYHFGAAGVRAVVASGVAVFP